MEPNNFITDSAENIDLGYVLRKNMADIMCRICFESDNTLINPCKCSGSMKYVHEACLKLWVLACNQEIKNSSCDICKEKFVTETILVKVCSFDKFKDEFFKILVFPFIILAVTAVFIIILAYLAIGIKQNILNLQEKIYFIIVMIACLIIIGALIYVLIKSIDDCYVLKIKEWYIKSLNQIDETFDLTNQTEMSPRLNKDEVPDKLIEVPSFAKYRGKLVKTPVIVPATIFQVHSTTDSPAYALRSETTCPRNFELDPSNWSENSNIEPLSNERTTEIHPSNRIPFPLNRRENYSKGFEDSDFTVRDISGTEIK
jgi:RING-variant domain